mgnify:CR=1 FL=1
MTKAAPSPALLGEPEIVGMCSFRLQTRAKAGAPRMSRDTDGMEKAPGSTQIQGLFGKNSALGELGRAAGGFEAVLREF